MVNLKFKIFVLKKDKGFTLIELVVVMAIIAILTGLSIFNFNQARMKARDISRKNDLRQFVNAFESYKAVYQSYPPDLDSLVPGYLAEVYIDPKLKLLAGSWEDYSYTPPTIAETLTFTLKACLENTGDADKLLVGGVGVGCFGGKGVYYQLTPQ